jgi:protein-disulfide isomerase
MRFIMRHAVRSLLLSGILFMGLAPHALAAGFDAGQREELEAIIKDYLLSHPEILKDMSELLQEKEKKAEDELRKGALASNAEQVFRDNGDFVAGNPRGTVTMVEFFDYNCGWCKKGFSEIVALLDSDKELKLVLKEFPIFGEDSEYAAKAAIAAGVQGKYWELHVAMFQNEGKITKAVVDELAAAQGLNMGQLKKDMESAATTDLINRNRALAQALAINGTPAFVIDDKLVPGYMPQDELASTIKEVREKGGCTLC